MRYYVQYFSKDTSGRLTPNGRLQSLNAKSEDEAKKEAASKAVIMDHGYQLFSGPMMSLLRPISQVYSF